MKFKSIRQKLISKVSIISTISFVCVLAIVIFMNAQDSERNFAQSESNIRNALLAKGKTLANNNSQALKGMVEDNAFSAVAELVSSTVSDDVDIVYGIFMDVDLMPWVNANQENETGAVVPGELLNDEVSQWAISLIEPGLKDLDLNGQRVFEFAAPVVVDEEPLGVIRYGISTKSMDESLQSASEASEKAFIKTIIILLCVGGVAILFGFLSTRRIASNITTPLNSLTETAEKIAGGEYGNEVNVKTDDEIGVLADNFETMRATIRKKMDDLAKLNSTGEVLASLLNQTVALEEVLQAMHEQIGVSQGSVYLMNEGGELEVKGHYPPKSTDANRHAQKFKVGDGILGIAAKEKEIVYVEDTSTDIAYLESDHGDLQSGKSLLCIPLIDKDILVGVMNCSGEKGEVHFEEADKEFAQAIARQLVITIKNIRMREVIEEQNRTLEHKVEERTAELAQKTNDIEKMLANMHQGLFTVMDGGVVHHEYAKYLEDILETPQIANRNMMDLLFDNSDIGSDKLDQINVATEAIIGEDEMMFDFNAHLLVTEFNRHFDTSDSDKVLELDWDPIVMDGQVEKLMVTVRDVTELKALQGHAESQKQELEIIGQILSLDNSKFKEFTESSVAFIETCKALISDTNDKDLEVVSSLFRNMHTVKGNARTYGFTYITDSVHEVENTYDELRKVEDKVWDQAVLLEELSTVEKDINRYIDIANNKLGRVDEESQNGASIDEKNVARLIDKLQSLDLSSTSSNVVDTLNNVFSTLVETQAQPLTNILSGVTNSITSLVQELGKVEPVIKINDGGLFIKNQAGSMLNNVFMHVMRNAVDHGIESAEERTQKGKSAEGTISISVEDEGAQATIQLMDDGRGLALHKIKQKALELGVLNEHDAVSDHDIANLIFSSGFSTAENVTEVSGRGVGMDAVRKFLEGEGGSIEILLNEEQSTSDFKTFVTKIRLPQKLFIRANMATSSEQQVA